MKPTDTAAKKGKQLCKTKNLSSYLCVPICILEDLLTAVILLSVLLLLVVRILLLLTVGQPHVGQLQRCPLLLLPRHLAAAVCRHGNVLKLGGPHTLAFQVLDLRLVQDHSDFCLHLNQRMKNCMKNLDNVYPRTGTGNAKFVKQFQ